MNRIAFALLAVLAVTILRAELPDTVIEACLSPVLIDQTSGKSWTVKTRSAWETQAVRVHERGESTIAEQDGVAHPDGWVKTMVSLLMPPQTAATPRPTQTFTVTATPIGALQQTMLDFELIKDARLPPCSIKPWGKRLAIVADAKDWYIIADNPHAKISQNDGPDRRITLRVSDRTTKGTSPVSEAILVGEGPLPPPPAESSKRNDTLKK